MSILETDFFKYQIGSKEYDHDSFNLVFTSVKFHIHTVYYSLVVKVFKIAESKSHLPNPKWMYCSILER